MEACARRGRRPPWSSRSWPWWGTRPGTSCSAPRSCGPPERATRGPGARAAPTARRPSWAPSFPIRTRRRAPAAQRRRPPPGRPGRGRLRQAPPADLRRVRRAPLLRARGRPSRRRGRRPARRPADLRGPLGLRPASAGGTSTTPIRPADLGARGSTSAVAIAASPFHQGKDAHRRALFAAEARRMGVPLVVVQQVGGNDDVLFDGRSRAFDAEGRDLARLAAFEEDFRVVDLDGGRARSPRRSPTTAATRSARALVMGIRDYFRKTGFSRRGDRALRRRRLRRDRLPRGRGPRRRSTCSCVGMPGPFSAPMSLEDARAQAGPWASRFDDHPHRRGPTRPCREVARAALRRPARST